MGPFLTITQLLANLVMWVIWIVGIRQAAAFRKRSRRGARLAIAGLALLLINGIFGFFGPFLLSTYLVLSAGMPAEAYGALTYTISTVQAVVMAVSWILLAAAFFQIRQERPTGRSAGR